MVNEKCTTSPIVETFYTSINIYSYYNRLVTKSFIINNRSGRDTIREMFVKEYLGMFIEKLHPHTYVYLKSYLKFIPTHSILSLFKERALKSLITLSLSRV